MDVLLPLFSIGVALVFVSTIMAAPPEAGNPAPIIKHKKKKVKVKEEERTEGEEKRTEGEEKRTEGTEGDKERTEGEEKRTEGTEGDKERKGDRKRTKGDKKRTEGDKKRTERTEGEEKRTERTEGEEKRTERTEGEEKSTEGTEGEEKRTERTEGEEKRTKGDKKRTERTEGDKERTEGEEKRTERIEGTERDKKRKQRPQTSADEEKKRKTHRHKSDNIETLSEGELLELQEFIPDVQTKSYEMKQRLMRYDLERFRTFKQRGLKLRWGPFSPDENLQITRNADDFLKMSGIASREQLLFPQRFQHAAELRKLRTTYRFYQRIADGLIRTCEAVYNRARKMLDQRHHMGRFSEEEVQTLVSLHTLHGNDWKTIGSKMERSGFCVERRFNQIAAAHGPWSCEEMELFKKAVKKQLKRLRPGLGPGLDSGPTFVQLCSKLNWTRISHKVKTRSWLQCRVKWFSYLRSRIRAKQPAVLPGDSVERRVRTINVLYELQVEELRDVDWIQVAESVGDMTPLCVQRLFHRLKVSRIPGWNRMSFGEMVDWLHENELPQLMKNLQTMKVSESDPCGSLQISLDHLFPKHQNQFMEVDNTGEV